VTEKLDAEETVTLYEIEKGFREAALRAGGIFLHNFFLA